MKLFATNGDRASLTRNQSLGGRPFRAAGLSVEPLPGGGLRVAVAVERRGLERWIAGSGVTKRRIELDSLGGEVFAACDGTATVAAIVARFAAAHRLSRPEAEMSVTRFLKMLMGRGLIAIDVPKKPEEDPDGSE